MKAINLTDYPIGGKTKWKTTLSYFQMCYSDYTSWGGEGGLTKKS